MVNCSLRQKFPYFTIYSREKKPLHSLDEMHTAPSHRLTDTLAGVSRPAIQTDFLPPSLTFTITEYNMPTVRGYLRTTENASEETY